MGESRGTVESYMQRAGLTFPVASDLSTEVAAEYRVNGVPSHFFIDRDGVVRDIRAGRLGKSTIDKELASIIGTKKAGSARP
jgi:peroxiredoxin